ncbi:MAG: T9SS type A sorting domain-containing protein [Tannerellaceae bacterium]|jgi:hypothetical protein|nr:T9SS type A sorting domain-containing protein [Tannerellaceae bacterium]
MTNRFLLFPCACILSGYGMMHAQSPYINKVYDFAPAPGQFVNVLPEYEQGDTKADMIRKADEAIAHNNKGMISLGGYGGYIVFGFDHPVRNIPGKYDFKVLGNAFVANANPNPDAPRDGGSCEPGIVMVSRDTNGNGIPDDEWYELAGSEYRKPETVRNYRIAYHKPDENKLRDPDPSYPYINDRTYIRWTTNGHGDGFLFRNTFHNQPYYPLWLTEDSLVFIGTKLADNYTDESGSGTYYVQYAYPYGYADNFPNNDPRSGLSIDWAVDASGAPVHLSEIHFVKVYTGVNQYCGWLGETSTEILGAEDLHLTGGDTDITTGNSSLPPSDALHILRNPVQQHLLVYSDTEQKAGVYNLTGSRVMSFVLGKGENAIDCTLPPGIYIMVASDGKTIKFLKK